MYELTKREELVLLSIYKLSGNAYIVTIRKNLIEITDKTVNYGSLCNTLTSLMRKALIASKVSEPEAVQGGRRKVLYSLTTHGQKALKRAYEVQKLAWDGLNGFVLGIE